MIGVRNGSIVGFLGRVVFEGLLWLPLWLYMTIEVSVEIRYLSLMLVAVALIVGMVCDQLKPPWRLISILVVMAGLVGGFALGGVKLLLIGVWLAVIAWKSRYWILTPLHYFIGFSLAVGGIIVATYHKPWDDYRASFVVLGIAWLAGWVLAVHRSFMIDAGLRGTIITRKIVRSSFWYALTFVGIALLLFLVTMDFGAKSLKSLKLKGHSTDSMVDQQLPDLSFSPPDMHPGELLKSGPGGLPLYMEIIVWLVITAFIFVLGACIVSSWRRRSWTWRSLKESFLKLFLRDRSPEELPYVEERRSLNKTQSKLVWSSLFQRSRREPAWDTLSDAEKVRRLYAEVVSAGVEAGYAHQASYTPAETLAGLGPIGASRSGQSADKRTAYWRWFAAVRQSLLRLYEQVRYSPHEVEASELAKLTEQHPKHGQRK